MLSSTLSSFLCGETQPQPVQYQYRCAPPPPAAAGVPYPPRPSSPSPHSYVYYHHQHHRPHSPPGLPGRARPCEDVRPVGVLSHPHQQGTGLREYLHPQRLVCEEVSRVPPNRPYSPAQLMTPEEEAVVLQAVHMRRSIAMLDENVRKISEPLVRDCVRDKRKLSAGQISVQQALAVLIEAQASADHIRLASNPLLPAILQVFHHKRKQPQYQCAKCGARSTTQWRNGPNNTKLCNSCGMKLWRKERKQKKACAAEAESTVISNIEPLDSPQEASPVSSPAQQQQLGCSKPEEEHRSNIYSLLN